MQPPPILTSVVLLVRRYIIGCLDSFERFTLNWRGFFSKCVDESLL